MNDAVGVCPCLQQGTAKQSCSTRDLGLLVVPDALQLSTVLLLTGASSGCDLQMELSGSSTLCSFQHEQRVLLPSEQVGSNRSTCIMLVLLLLNHVLFCFWFVPSSGACFCD